MNSQLTQIIYIENTSEGRAGKWGPLDLLVPLTQMASMGKSPFFFFFFYPGLNINKINVFADSITTKVRLPFQIIALKIRLAFISE